jgi:hypothetical protein
VDFDIAHVDEAIHETAKPVFVQVDPWRDGYIHIHRNLPSPDQDSMGRGVRLYASASCASIADRSFATQERTLAKTTRILANCATPKSELGCHVGATVLTATGMGPSMDAFENQCWKATAPAGILDP